MPLILHENIENGEIGLWKISEDVDTLFLLAKLSDPDILTYSLISAAHRKREWLATRALLNELSCKPYLIKYHSDGRPYLENSRVSISISHSTGYVAILLHTSAAPGIDIELINRHVGRVASRFLSPDELAVCNENNEHTNRLMLLHWCAKEAIFKMIPFSNIEFATDIRILINEFAENSGSFQGTFNDKSAQIPIPLSYKLVSDVLIVWGCIDETRFIL